MKESSKEYPDECIICFENSTQDNPLYFLKDIPSIIKTCNCSYKSHISCMQLWIQKNSCCLLCSEKLIPMPKLLDTSIIHPGIINNLALSMPLISREEQQIPSSPRIQYSPPPSYLNTIAQGHLEQISSTQHNNTIRVTIGDNDRTNTQIDEFTGDDESLDDNESSENRENIEEELTDNNGCSCCCVIILERLLLPS